MTLRTEECQNLLVSMKSSKFLARIFREEFAGGLRPDFAKEEHGSIPRAILVYVFRTVLIGLRKRRFLREEKAASD